MAIPANRYKYAPIPVPERVTDTHGLPVPDDNAYTLEYLIIITAIDPVFIFGKFCTAERR